MEKVYLCGGEGGVVETQNFASLQPPKYQISNNMENNQITDSIEEARRYVANAEETIKKAKYDSELKSYTDSKYIKAAVAKRDKKLLNSLTIVLR